MDWSSVSDDYSRAWTDDVTDKGGRCLTTRFICWRQSTVSQVHICPLNDCRESRR